MLTHSLLKMTDLELAHQRVLIREDFNVPIKDGQVTDTTRIERALPTLKLALEAKAEVIVMSHLGRPEAGKFEEKYSLAPVVEVLKKLLGVEVVLQKNLENVQAKLGEITLLENVRFHVGEKENDAALAQKLAALCDVFVMDAFATAHRAEASTEGVARYAPQACAGPLLIEELTTLEKVVAHPKPPVIAIVGGSKVSTKIRLLESLIKKVNVLIVGGGIANTFLAARGLPIGQSLAEHDYLAQAKQLLNEAEKTGVKIPLPMDVAVANRFSEEAKATIKDVNAVADDELILDVGPQTAATYSDLMQSAKTIIWNGPVGVFEFPAFAYGTQALTKAIANSPAYSIAGGGDTIAAINQFSAGNKISYICTGGGAFLEFLQGDTLPAINQLLERAQRHGQ